MTTDNELSAYAILDAAEDVIFEGFTAGANFSDALEVVAKAKGLSDEDKERVANAVQIANIKVWWDPDVVV